MTATDKHSSKTLEYTVKLSKLVRGIAFKKRAPRAIREIRKLATRFMCTPDVVIAPELNSIIWSHGIRYLPTKMRLRFERRLNEDEKSKNACYTLVQYVECSDFKNKTAESILNE